MRITKEMQANLLQKELDVSHKRAIEILDAVEGMIQREVADGHIFKLNGVGNIFRKEVAGRYYRNPKTGENNVWKPTHYKAAFKASRDLTTAINY